MSFAHCLPGGSSMLGHHHGPVDFPPAPFHSHHAPLPHWQHGVYQQPWHNMQYAGGPSFRETEMVPSPYDASATPTMNAVHSDRNIAHSEVFFGDATLLEHADATAPLIDQAMPVARSSSMMSISGSSTSTASSAFAPSPALAQQSSHWAKPLRSSMSAYELRSTPDSFALYEDGTTDGRIAITRAHRSLSLATTTPLPPSDLVAPPPTINGRVSHSHRVPRGYVKRPPNGFLRFRSHFLAQNAALPAGDPARLDESRAVSRAAGIVWQKMSRVQQKPWTDAARKAMEEFRRLHPELSPSLEDKPRPTKRPRQSRAHTAVNKEAAERAAAQAMPGLGISSVNRSLGTEMGMPTLQPPDPPLLSITTRGLHASEVKDTDQLSSTESTSEQSWSPDQSSGGGFEPHTSSGIVPGSGSFCWPHHGAQWTGSNWTAPAPAPALPAPHATATWSGPAWMTPAPGSTALTSCGQLNSSGATATSSILQPQPTAESMNLFYYR